MGMPLALYPITNTPSRMIDWHRRRTRWLPLLSLALG